MPHSNAIFGTHFLCVCALGRCVEASVWLQSERQCSSFVSFCRYFRPSCSNLDRSCPRARTQSCLPPWWKRLSVTWWVLVLLTPIGNRPGTCGQRFWWGFLKKIFNSIVPVGFIVPVVTLLSQLALYCPSWHFIVPAGALLSQWVLYCPIWHSLVPIGALLFQLALCSPSRLYHPSWPSIVPVGTLLSQLALYCSGWHSVVPVGNFHRGKSGPFQRRAIC